MTTPRLDDRLDTTGDVVAALERAGVRDVDSSSLARALYSSDASLYRVEPTVVVRPHDLDEIHAVVEACRTTGTPLTSRGAGTSIAGNAIGTGVVLDFSRHMNRIIAIDEATRTAEVQPGVVHAALQRVAAPLGLRYGPDPSTHTRCTVGGMIGNNACGNRALGYGRSADNVAALDLLTMAGERFQVGRDVVVTSDRLEGLRSLVGANLSTVRTEFGRFGRQVSGYSLEHLLPERGFDVASFMAGTEGTLAVTLGATVDLVRDAPVRHLVVLSFPSMAEAADHVPAILPFEPIACEGLGGRIVEVYRAAHGASSVPDLPSGDGFLYVELAGDDAAELQAQADRVVRASGALGHRHVTSPIEQSVLWRIREEGAGLASRAWDRPALAGWEDAAVPPEHLGRYLREFEDLLVQHDLHGTLFGHFGDGCVHVRIDFPLDAPDGHRGFRSFLTDAATLAASHGGSFSGEHGDGRARSELLPLMYSPEAIGLFEQVKHVFDPEDLLNPGVLVRPRPVDSDLRGLGAGWPAGLPAGRKGLRLLHDDGDFGAAVHRCTGVGKCLAAPASGVMCPSFQATRNEKDSTRGRARVLQEMVDGRLVDGGWSSPEVHEALDLCLSCKGCVGDCPTGVDMATYKSEVLHQTYRGRLRPRSHYILGRLPFWARLTAPIARLANLALRMPGLAHVGRWIAGVDQRRSLPQFATRTFSKVAADERTSTGGDPVLLWADSFTEYFSTDAGRAAVRLLEAAGYEIRLLERQQCCGLTWISTGQLDHAAELAAAAVDQLHPYVEAGIPVVGLEPSCLAVLRTDAVELVDDPRAAEVAKGVFTLAELLADREELEVPDLSGQTVVVQPHCHQASVLGFDADLRLLSRTGAHVVRVGGCCGLAGNFGVEKGHYEVSVAVAETQLLPAVREAGPDAIVVADGFSCRMQLDDLADVRAVHLAQLLLGER
ncbi:FAD-binding and (Fe-S)-binding domain-containing protein [Aeromicrobium duanguangcaii]|uniref:FAD-binding and (Fe-S)-binding domain-containing protein n=1 Tax=Aeromicrobium duanguangcaii TaxID=2968086 RepID=UPI002016B7DB|nr:FAD-binding and (Fe-S)-binding domain-containing protein [Aeromicrobium duanguangcaii]MCL3837702.1 FAD-binding protein [Aeromicrobium duanguangcaii]